MTTKDELKHVGVLGMRWGVRTGGSEGGGGSGRGSGLARKNTEQTLKDARRIYRNKGSGKNPKSMTDKEIKAEITKITSAKQSKKIQANIAKENARIAKRADAAMRKKMDATARWNAMGPVHKTVATTLAVIGTVYMAQAAAGLAYGVGKYVLGGH